MGQLTNLYVSQSYQGLLKMTDSTNGLTNTLQTVQTGDGDNSPLQMSFTQVNISGSLTVNGQPISVDSGSFVTTSSFNAYTSSVNTQLAGLNIETGSLQNQINGLATTGSLSGYTTTTVFNNYTSSNDSKVNSLIASTGSYATTSSLTSLSQSIALTDLNQDNVIAGLATTSSLTSLSSSIATTDLSQNNRLTALEGVTGSINRNGLITTGSIGGNQSITGSLGISGTLTALSASITYLETVYETASVIYSSGSNQFGDASNDTQTLWGTVKIPSGPVDITGSVKIASQSGTPLTVDHNDASPTQNTLIGFLDSGSAMWSIGNQGTSDSFIVYNPQTFTVPLEIKQNNSVVFSGPVTSSGFFGNLQGTASFATNALSASWAPDNSNRDGLINTGSIATTQSITGSLIVSGSANFVGPVGLNLLQPDNFKQNLTILGGINHFTSSTVLNNYLNAITTSLNNNDNNFVMVPGASISSPAGIASLTGSVFISGSNNLILNLGSGQPASQGRRQVWGSANIGLVSPTINTSSLTIPAINNNYQGGGITLTFTTGSNFGNNAHVVSTNVNLGNITWNHPSASLVGTSTQLNNNVNVGAITSTTTGPTILSSSATLVNNIISNANLGLNHISSSIQFSNNIVGGNGLTVNNSYYQTGSNNFLAASANIFAGQGITITASGSAATNVSRTLVGNIIGGQTVNVNLIQNNLDTAGLRNSLIYGQGLVVLGSHSAASTAQNSIAILGRWNGQDNGLDDSARTVFAVGTGTGTSNRRTSLYVTSGSLVGVSGSLDVKGVTNALTVTGSATIQHSVAGQSALTVIAQSAGQPAITATGSLNVSGSGDHYINGNSTNITSQFSVNGNTNVTGSLRVSGSSADHSIIGARLFLTASLNASSSFDHNIVGSQINITGNTSMYGNSDFPLTVYGTINSKRLHFTSNPFNSNPSSNLAAIRFEGNNQTFYSTNYDTAQITTQSQVFQTVITGSNLVETGLQSNNMGSDYSLTLKNQSGTGSLITNANVIVTGSLNVSGSAVITGSVQGNVLPLTVTSNTASLNLNNGNFFELALTGSSDIRIEPSNIKPGQTINIKLNTTGSGTVSFPTSVKQPSGSAYIPTTTVGTDILTMVSFDTTNLFVANVKNLI